MLLLACLVVAGCTDANNDTGDNHDRFGGFYGGINGGAGMAR
jgi:hypothetical protein